MKFQDRNLSLEMRGADVGLLHAGLLQIGYPIAEDESARDLFGATTRDAVTAFQRRSGLVITGALDEATARALDAAVDPATECCFKVRGTIRAADGSRFMGAVARAYDVDLEVAQLLGEAQSSCDGLYEICYTKGQFAVAEKGTADLRVEVYVGNTLRAESEVLFNAPPIAVVNLFLAEEGYHGVSEFERLTSEITPLLSGQNVTVPDLTEEHVVFLSNDTGIESLKIALFVVAYRVGADREAPLEPAVFYGLFRQGLPTLLPQLLTQGRVAWESALRGALTANVVPARLGDNLVIPAVLEALAGLAVSTALAPSQLPGWSSLGDYLGVVSNLSVDLQKRIARIWFDHTGTVEEYWAAILADSQTAPYLPTLQQVFQLGAITQSHLLTAALRADSAATMGALAAKTPTDWLTYLTQHTDVEVPIDVGVGENDAVRRGKYANILARVVEDAVPTLVIRERIGAGAPPALQDVRTFLLANTERPDPTTEFDFRTTYIDRFLLGGNGVPADPADKAAFVDMLKTHQRLLRVSHRFAEIDAMRTLGYDSAHTVTRLGQAGFVASMTGLLGSATAAEELYQRAEHASAMALHLYGRYGAAMNETSLPAMPSSADMAVAEGGAMHAIDPPLPSYSMLFGGLDYCGCEHCASVLSPSAYLVDLLDMLRRAKVGAGPGTALDALVANARRPDLTKIDLTCENAERVLPYIDLVNEVLESAITGAGFARQTTLDEKTLRVQPEHVDAAAYTTLAQDVYPWSLPFDLPGAQARGYLDQMGVGRGDVMRGFRQPLAPDNTPSPTDADVAAATFGLSPLGWKVVTGGLEEKPSVRAATTGNIATNSAQLIDGVNVVAGDRVLVKNQILAEENGIFIVVANMGWTRAPDADSANDVHRGLYVTVREGGQQGTRWLMTANIAPYVVDQTALAFEQSLQPGDKDALENPWLYWGYPGPNQPAAFLTDLQGVEKLLGRSGMSWDDLVTLLRTRYVNGSGSLQITWADASCNLKNASINAIDVAATRRIHRFERLRRLLGWTIPELDQALSAIGAIEITDEAVMKLAEIDRQHRELHLPVDEVLAFWGPFQARDYGTPSLYERLFLNPAIQKPVDPAFALHVDRTELANPNDSIQQHAQGVMAALGIGPLDLALLLLNLSATNMRLADLTELYRAVSLARRLGLSLVEFLALLGCSAHAKSWRGASTTTRTWSAGSSRRRTRSAGSGRRSSTSGWPASSSSRPASPGSFPTSRSGSPESRRARCRRSASAAR